MMPTGLPTNGILFGERPTSSHRRDIDGLRAIAIVPVILFHAHIALFGGGYLGVDVFFVVSGFLITSLIAPEIAQGQFSYLSFWERRARRLLPAMLLVVAATAFAAYWILVPSELDAFGRSVVSIVFFASNVYFWQHSGYFDTAQTMPLLHTWSLAVEEQFYLLFPAVLIATSWSKRLHPVAVVTLIGAASLAISVWWTHAYPSAAYYLLPSRAWELMLGAGLALLRPSRRASFSPFIADALILTGLCLILIPVLLYDSHTLFPGIAALVPCAGTALVIWFGDQRCRATRLLDNRPMVFIGQLSYSLYLWHWPLILFAGMLRRHPSSTITGTQTLLVLAATFVCAWLSFVLVENPIRRRTVLPTRRLLVAALGTSATLLATIGLIVALEHGLPNRLPEAAMRIAAAADDRTDDWERCGTRPDRDIRPEDLCHFGPKNDAAPRFLLWGDSHALALFPAVDAAAKATGISGLHASLFQCPPVPGVDVNVADVDCSGFNRRISNLIDSERFDAVILDAYWSNYLTPRVRVPNGFGGGGPSEFFEAQLAASIQRLSSKGIAVFVVDQVPSTRNFRPEQLARAVWWGRKVDEPGISVAEYASRMQPFQTALSGLRFERISLVNYLCIDGSFCPAVADGWPNYFDPNHLSAHGAMKVTPAFIEALQRIGSIVPREHGAGGAVRSNEP